METLFPKMDEIIYPESDGKPIAENTLQFTWIVMLKENIETLFGDRDDVFVAGDLLWYPVEGKRIATAPDTMVVFGRPKGYRGSYKQWEEGGLAPQVVFEVLSPSNKPMRLDVVGDEMGEKLRFFARYGVEECYYYDPETNEFWAWVRSPETDDLVEVAPTTGWISPRLQIRFQPEENPMGVYHPNGDRFTTHQEISQQLSSAIETADAVRLSLERQRELTDLEAFRAARESERATQEAARAEQAAARAEQAAARAEQEAARAAVEYARAERLAARLRELGITE